jgi:hypothetical protein
VTIIDRWSALGNAGVTVSICHGPCAGHGVAWTVLANKNGEEFDLPVLATSFDHCVEIAEIEAKERGWIEAHASGVNAPP